MSKGKNGHRSRDRLTCVGPPRTGGGAVKVAVSPSRSESHPRESLVDADAEHGATEEREVDHQRESPPTPEPPVDRTRLLQAGEAFHGRPNYLADWWESQAQANGDEDNDCNDRTDEGWLSRH